MRFPFVVTALTLAASTAAAQEASRVGPRRLLPRQEEIALARSAAPAAVSARARVYVLTDRGYVVADSGSNGVACYVSRSWRESLEPHCFDEEGARTIMPMEMHEVELLHAGRSRAEADAEIAQGLLAGRFQLPQRPAMSWMMSAEQLLYNDQGRRVGNWRPHLMIYYPYLRAAALGLAEGPDPNHGYLEHDGQAKSNIIVVVPNFTATQPAGAPPRSRD